MTKTAQSEHTRLAPLHSPDSASSSHSNELAGMRMVTAVPRVDLLEENFRQLSHSASEITKSVGLNEMNQQLLGDLSNATIISAGNSVGQFQASASAHGFEAAAQRTTDHSDFSARSAVWRTQNEMNDVLSGIATAYGAIPGSFEPGAKPTNLNGQAMVGALDRGIAARLTSAKAQYFSGDTHNGFFASIRFYASFINQEFGPAKIGSLFQSWTPFSAVMQAVRATKEFISAPK